MRTPCVHLLAVGRAVAYQVGAMARPRYSQSGLWRILALGAFLHFAACRPILFAQSPPPSPARGVTELLQPQGWVEVLPAGGTIWIRAVTNRVLRPGDVLRTGQGSRALVRLANDSVVRLDEATLLQIRDPRQRDQNPLLHLLKGALYFFHRDQPVRTQFETPLVSGAIRGTEFNLAVADKGRTVLTLLDGEVELSNPQGQLTLATGEQAVVEPGAAPRQTAMLEAVNIIQWCLYYPAVLDLAELPLSAGDLQTLRDSLNAYRSGDLLRALERYPPDRPPASPGESVYRAALLLAVGQVQQAEQWLASTAAPGNVEARLGELSEALRKLIAAVKFQTRDSTQPAQHATSLLAASYYQQSRANLTEALHLAQAAATNSPGFGFAWARVAELEFSFGHTKQALAALEKALELAPRHAQAYVVKGFVLAGQNKTTQALGQFEQALAIDSALANAWLGRGLCRIRQGHVRAGRDDLLVAAALEPNRALPRSYLGKAFQEVNDPARTARELQLARRLDPSDPTAWLYSALLNQQRNRINEAIRDLEQSAELNDNRRLYRSRLLLDQDRAVRGANLAAMYQDAGMTEVAQREAARAVNADYANYSAHLFLANTYAQLSDPFQVNLRYETPRVSEYLLATLLAPPGAGILSPTVSQQEYSRLFERDRLGIVSETEYLSRGAWAESAAQYGTMGNFGYSLDAYYRSDPGQRVNNDLEQTTLSLRLKQQITPADGLYFQVVCSEAEGGDLAQYYDPFNPTNGANPLVRSKETQEPILLAGYHREWAPGVHTLVLAGRLQDTLTVHNPQLAVLDLPRDPATGQVLGVLPISAEQHYRSEMEIYSAEAQQILQREHWTTILGARFQTGDFHTRNTNDVTPPFFPQDVANPAQDFHSDFERLSVYAYQHCQVAKPLRLIVGLSYDRLTFPVNHRFAPISDQEDTDDQLSPKAGMIFSLTPKTTLRAGYGRSLGGVSFDQSFQLEPTQIAGFNQSWRSLIPESVAGANAAARFESWGVSLEHQFPTRTYVGLSGEWLASEVDRLVGTYEVFPPAPGPLVPFIFQGSTPENLDYTERALTVTLNQLLGNEWSLGARYRLSRAELEDVFPETLAVPPANLFGGFRPHQDLEATLHQLDLFTIWNHPSGLFAQADARWFAQSNRGYAPEQHGDDFWQFNLLVGYRFPRRRAELVFGVLNLSDQDYRLNPLNLYLELPRERTFLTSLRVNF